MDDAQQRQSELSASHTPEQVRLRLQSTPEHIYVKDFIYGAIDGTVTTFAVVSGVAGAGLPSSIIIILGFANLIGDGFSMAAGNYLGTRAESQLLAKARRAEQAHIALHPDGEREEIRQIYANKGFSGEQLEHIVDVITADNRRWIDVMLTEELGIRLNVPSPIRAALTTLIAFILVGGIPLSAFVLTLFAPNLLSAPYQWSCLLTAVAFFGVGAAKSKVVDQHWLWAGFETLLVGGCAAVLAYVVGAALRGIA